MLSFRTPRAAVTTEIISTTSAASSIFLDAQFVAVLDVDHRLIDHDAELVVASPAGRSAHHVAELANTVEHGTTEVMRVFCHTGGSNSAS